MQDAAVQYLKQNEVHKIIETLTQQLLTAKPREPIDFLCTRIRKLQNGGIKEIKCREIISGSGYPTIELEIINQNGTYRVSVPSTAYAEDTCVTLLDKDINRYLGKGVLSAVRLIQTNIVPELIGRIPCDQKGIDELMLRTDGTRSKERLGCNSLLAVSLCAAHAAADIEGAALYEYIAKLCENTNILTLPVLVFAIISGGKVADNPLGIQSYMIAMTGAGSARNAVRIATEIFHHVESALQKKYGTAATQIASDGAFAPPITSVVEPLEIILRAGEQAGHTGKFKIMLDCNSSTFAERSNGFKYNLNTKQKDAGSDLLDSAWLSGLYTGWIKNYQIVGLVDPFDREDWSSWAKFTQSVAPQGVQVFGGVLTDGSVERVRKAIEQKACNAFQLHISKIGTLTELANLVKYIKQSQSTIQFAHEWEGETEDPSLVDIAIGTGCGQLFVGSVQRGECVAKCNHLLRIEDDLVARKVRHVYGTKEFTKT